MFDMHLIAMYKPMSKVLSDVVVLCFHSCRLVVKFCTPAFTETQNYKRPAYRYAFTVIGVGVRCVDGFINIMKDTTAKHNVLNV